MKDSNVTEPCSDHMLLRSIFDYNPKTGTFTYLVQRGPMRAGSEAGTINSEGYIQMRLDGKMQYAHRLAVLWMTGHWPEHDVDHKDLNRSNNRWWNLRVAGKTVNNRNKSMHRNNTSGHVGVSWDSSRGLWAAHIGVGSRTEHLGRFSFYEDAVTARLEAEIKFGYTVDKVWDDL